MFVEWPNASINRKHNNKCVIRTRNCFHGNETKAILSIKYHYLHSKNNKLLLQNRNKNKKIKRANWMNIFLERENKLWKLSYHNSATFNNNAVLINDSSDEKKKTKFIGNILKFQLNQHHVKLWYDSYSYLDILTN